MKKIARKVRENLFILAVGVVYYFSFSAMNIGDSFFRSMENGYPLFFDSNFGEYPAWFGFEPPHFLGVPTLRLIQVLISGIGLLPNALIILQAVNLILSLCTLKLVYSVLLKINVKRFVAGATTVLFAFSYGFYANMNGEIHHFSIFLLAAVIWLLAYIKNTELPSGRHIFLASLCLALLPLYHLETIIFSAVAVVYILARRKIRRQFLSNWHLAVLGAVVLPLIIIGSSIVFHYFDTGRQPIKVYLSSLPEVFRLGGYKYLAAKAYSNFGARGIYILLRSHLESFSVVSRSAKILQHYKDVIFYAGRAQAGISAAIAIAYVFMFLSTNLIAAVIFIKKRAGIAGFVKFLAVMLLAYLIMYGCFFSNVYLYSEFFVTSAMLHCILLGYIFNLHKNILYYFFIALTVFSNIFLYIYPQKVSAKSFQDIFVAVSRDNRPEVGVAIFRGGFINFPYSASFYPNFNIYFDEHAYDSHQETLDYIKSLDREFESGKRVYLICPAFMIGTEKDINVNSLASIGMDEGENLSRNLVYFIDYIQNKYKTVIKKGYPYNFGTLGQLGQLAVVELRK